MTKDSKPVKDESLFRKIITMTKDAFESTQISLKEKALKNDFRSAYYNKLKDIDKLKTEQKNARHALKDDKYDISLAVPLQISLKEEYELLGAIKAEYQELFNEEFPED